MRRRNKNKNSGGAPKWMTTFSDLMSLMLTFFVLLFAMSQIDSQRFEALAESFRNQAAFNIFSSGSISNESTGGDVTVEPDESIIVDLPEADHDLTVDELASDSESLEELLREVEAYLADNGLNNLISANRSDQGVVLILQEQILFDSGEAIIKSEGEPFLDKVAVLLSSISNKVRVEGHTDNRPISTPQFPSNWELSGARASSVIRYILTNNDFEEDRFVAVGYGDTQPVASNNSPENWQKNRRVEIVILELSRSFD
ncbi:chemotaxis protein MotB [Amphibacillus marinus]|uniref:Chemotaxis protein MotB n=1 Tax=Amphibacillus marinus TaxID=872970 RepID=A0A1H8T0U5_9BACI|nr:flagellar motor protein MotS [Amphibacillus marinus]SEO84406.1 chemotaxis protein MotB [Amphibacillus marinus]